MAFLAERFPVGLIPEQPLVAPVRNDMIHHGCGDDLALRLTESAQRMLLQEQGAGLTPAGVISTGMGSLMTAFVTGWLIASMDLLLDVAAIRLDGGFWVLT